MFTAAVKKHVVKYQHVGLASDLSCQPKASVFDSLLTEQSAINFQAVTFSCYK